MTTLWRLWVLIGCIVAAGWLFLTLDWGERFDADVTVLLPAAKAGKARQLLSLVREEEERLILGVIAPPAGGWGEVRAEVAAMVWVNLKATGLFAEVAEGAGPSDPDAVAAAVYEGRFDLLLPQWAEEAALSVDEADASRWVEAIITSFEDFLTQPEATALADVVPSDPFPLAAYMARSAPVEMTTDEAGPILFWAVQTASPFTPQGQDPIFAAFEEARARAEAILPGAMLRYASVGAFAAESERSIRREITWLNALALLLVALVVLLFIRRRAMLLHLLALAALAVAGGLAAVVLVFPVVHVLSLVVGGLLVGIAVDYGIHILLHRPTLPEGGFKQTLRDVRRPLIASAFSTAGGFAALAFSDLELIRQIGVFVAGGLVAAFLAALLYFPLWRRPRMIARVPPPKERRHAPPWMAVPGILLLVVPLAGWLRLEWRDDLRDLQPPLQGRWEADAEVRRLFSQGEAYTAWLCPGNGPREARESLGRLEAEWAASGGEQDALRSLAPWVADPAARDSIRDRFRRMMPEFEEEFIHQFQKAGFEAEVFDPFLEELRGWLAADAPSFEYRVAAVEATLDGPAGMLLRGGPEGWWFLASAPEASVPEAWQPPAGIVTPAQLETLNELFADYRRAAWRLSGVALLVIGGGVMLIYGLSGGAARLFLPALAWAWGMGILAAFASPLNLFHVLGGFLGFCVALDYGLFFGHARRIGRGLPLSIRVSAATSLCAFGVLAFATIPAVAALGSSVFAVVFGALFIVEMAAVFPSIQRAL